MTESGKEAAGGRAPWRERLHEIIFEADTPAGKAFDVVLLVAIILSVIAVMMESTGHIRARYGDILRAIEWGFTILFTVEYLLRLITVGKPLRYAFSFFGVVDLLAIAPTYLSIIIPGSQSMLVIRILRLLRIFRIFKLAQFVGEAGMLKSALQASSRKIIVFLEVVVTLLCIIGALMYLIEGESNGFTSIPQSIYWAVVTMTTVGYGDLAPQTWLGKLLASIVMIIGYGIIAVPTGIVTVSLTEAHRKKITTQACPECSAEGHEADAKYCRVCGGRL